MDDRRPLRKSVDITCASSHFTDCSVFQRLAFYRLVCKIVNFWDIDRVGRQNPLWDWLKHILTYHIPCQILLLRSNVIYFQVKNVCSIMQHLCWFQLVLEAKSGLPTKNGREILISKVSSKKFIFELLEVKQIKNYDGKKNVGPL